MALLEEVKVDRVDGVEDPATKREFLILKSEEPDELRANAERALTLVARALELLHKSIPELEDEATVQALNDVSKALGLELEWKACKKPSKPEEEEEYGYGYGYPKPPKRKEADIESTEKSEEPTEPSTAQPISLDDIRRVVEEVVANQLSAVQKSAPKSNQLPDPTTKRTLGSGLFEDIIFPRR
jgi:hypothetical protein